jgi:ankyrin repeat protein
MLLGAGADVNAQGGEYSNVLQGAASRGKEEVVKMLLDAGADVNAQGSKYSDALQAAVLQGNKKYYTVLQPSA